MDVTTKSIGELVDALITADLRCWFAQETLKDTSLSEHDRLEAALTAQRQNALRSELIRAINNSLGQESSTVGVKKTYSET